ncbi:MAG TPA: hypothetical protein VHM70_05980 [Polyangiaceae bacterium]|jgi:hypothetical protein|nr:hypothetical protein [Polyangiaceae bacterium]
MHNETAELKSAKRSNARNLRVASGYQRGRLAAASAISLAFFGCKGAEGDDAGNTPEAVVAISHQGAALTAQDNAAAALRGVIKAGGFVAESQSLASSLSSLDSSSSTDCSGSVSTTVCDANNVCTTTPATETCDTTSSEVTTADLEQTRQDLDDAVEKLLKKLKEEVFIDANLESDDGMVVVYKLPESLVCASDAATDDSVVPPAADGSDTTTDAAPDDTASASDDADCKKNFAKLQPRLRLSSPSDGDIDVAVLLTADKRNPITLQLYSDRVGVVVDLGETKATLDAAGEDLDGVTDLDGKIGVELVRNAELDYSLRYNVLEDVHIVAGDKGKEVDVTLASSSPTGELRLDGNKKQITGTLNFGAMEALMPLAALEGNSQEYDESGNPLPPKEYHGMIDMVLGGLDGSLTFDGTKDVLHFKGIGLGDVATTLKFDSETILQLDINKDQGRHFDLDVASNGDQGATLTFSPTLDVNLLLKFAALADQIDDLDQSILNDELHVWFDGADPSVHVQSGKDLQVVSGTLHIDDKNGDSLSVDPGMCLVAAEDDGSAVTSVTQSLTAGVCE